MDESENRRVIGVKVDAQSSKRTVSMKLIFEGNDSLTLEMPLATATRLTDELIDAEFLERCPGMGALSRDPELRDLAAADIGYPVAEMDRAMPTDRFSAG